MLSTLLGLGLLAQCVALIRAYNEEKQLRSALSRYENISSVEVVVQRLEGDIKRQEQYIQRLTEEERAIDKRLKFARAEISVLDEKEHLQSLGFYEPKYDFSMSQDYKMRFDQITAECKRMVKQGTACISNKSWTVGDDPKKGQKMIKDYLKVIQSAFDTICLSAINDAKIKNINSLQKRMSRNFERLNKSSKVLDCQISQKYLNLRLKQLDVKYEMELKKQEEREQAKVIRDKLREEKKERKELEQALKEEEEAVKREEEYREEIEKIRMQMKQAVGRQLQDLRQQNESYEKLIAKAQQDQKDAISSYRAIKSGTIYVLSNEGSLGQGVFKICMTKSNDPDSYVRNMNPSVPFPFTTHIKAYSEDVSGTLEKLYDRFSNQRINKANLRRDFFRVSLQEISIEIRMISDETGFIKNIEEPDDLPLQNEYIRSLGKT